MNIYLASLQDNYSETLSALAYMTLNVMYNEQIIWHQLAVSHLPSALPPDNSTYMISIHWQLDVYSWVRNTRVR